jgi:hypothetical protein
MFTAIKAVGKVMKDGGGICYRPVVLKIRIPSAILLPSRGQMPPCTALRGTDYAVSRLLSLGARKPLAKCLSLTGCC